MQKRNIAIIIFSVFIFSIQIVFSQINFSDSLQYHQAEKNTRDIYRSLIKENLMLYNGSEYGRTNHAAFGFPFFLSDSLINGSIVYNNNLYEDINFQYDIVIDRLVIYDYKKNYFITLAAEKTNEFIIDGHHFYYLQNNATLKNIGFYEKLVDGTKNLWGKREKKLLQSSNAEDRGSRFIQYNSFFVEKNNQFFSADNESSLMKIMDDKKEELKKYIRKNKLRFGKQFESSAIKLVTYYNQLIQ